jgi:hypothetical protein
MSSTSKELTEKLRAKTDHSLVGKKKIAPSQEA